MCVNVWGEYMHVVACVPGYNLCCEVSSIYPLFRGLEDWTWPRIHLASTVRGDIFKRLSFLCSSKTFSEPFRTRRATSQALLLPS